MAKFGVILKLAECGLQTLCGQGLVSNRASLFDQAFDLLRIRFVSSESGTTSHDTV